MILLLGIIAFGVLLIAANAQAYAMYVAREDGALIWLFPLLLRVGAWVTLIGSMVTFWRAA